jgi:hypothetical protein
LRAWEPPLNRRRGDNFSAAEYLQVEDPEIENIRQRELAARILNFRRDTLT